MEFKDLLRVARRRWVTIVSVFLVVLIASAAVTFTSTRQYQSTAKVFVASNVSNSADPSFALALASARVQSYADLATGSHLLRQVIDQLGLKETPSSLAKKVSAVVEANSVIIDVTAQATDPHLAQRIAQAEADALAPYITNLETPSGKPSGAVKATVTSAAEYQGSPVSPRAGLNLVAAATSAC